MKKIFAFNLLLMLQASGFCQSALKSMMRLPDTGQNTSYTTTFGEDADYNFNIPFYILNGNGTVTDTVTSLMWQQTDGGEMTIENAQLYCDTLTLGGYTDWRLPDCHELFGILNHDRVNPAIDTIYFTKTLAEYWWSNQRQANDSNKVWVTNAGGGVGNHPKTETISAGGPKRFHVRAVRDITTPAVLPNHFTNNGNGTVTDNLTNLIWQKIPYADTLTWEQALNYADTLSLTGYNDWRLPNIKELQSINDEGLINPSLNTNYFNVSTGNKYWSSTTLPNQTSKAWYLYTQYGITTYDEKTLKNYLICVRGNNLTTAINEILKASNNVSVLPNPFTSTITTNSKSANEYCELINCYGQIIYSGKNIEQQNFSSLAKGIYFLKVIEKTTLLIKLLKV